MGERVNAIAKTLTSWIFDKRIRKPVSEEAPSCAILMA